MHPLRKLDGTEFQDIQGKICVEVGVYRGDFAQHIANCLTEKLYLVDCWEHQDSYDDVANLPNDQQMDNYMFTKARFAGNNHVELIKGYSSEASLLFAEGVIDFVYIDANHSEVACYSDLVVWFHKLKIGGWICGHDYTWPSVQAAINNYCIPRDYSYIQLTRDSWGIQR